MHYNDGTEVKLGDIAKTVATEEQKKYNITEVMGIVVSGVPSSTACNLELLPIARRDISPLGVVGWIPFSNNGGTWCATAGDCAPVNRETQ